MPMTQAPPMPKAPAPINIKPSAAASPPRML